jgi:hypothetical protein
MRHSNSRNVLICISIVGVTILSGLAARYYGRITPRNRFGVNETPVSASHEDSFTLPRATFIPAIRSDLFGQPVQSVPVQFVHRKRAATPTILPSPPNPLADYTFTGVVSRDGITYALLEDRKTKDGFYVRVGDVFKDFTVDAITPKGITFRTRAGPKTIAMRDDYSLIPLDKNTYPFEDGVRLTDQPTRYSETIRTFLVSRINGEMALSVGEDIAKLKDDVFDGKMTAEEFNQRAGNGSVSSLALRYIYSTSVGEAGRLNVEVLR